MIKKILLTLSLLVSCGQLHAEQLKRFGDWEVHYMALSSTFITPKVAKAYGIVRSRYSGLINISVLNSEKTGKPAQAVNINGVAKDLMGKPQTLQFKEIKEGDAIYYIAQFDYQNEEIYNFSIDISNGTNHNHKLTFSQKFYTD